MITLSGKLIVNGGAIALQFTLGIDVSRLQLIHLNNTGKISMSLQNKQQVKINQPANHYQESCLVISVLGHRFLKDEKVLKCIKSWRNLQGNFNFKIISDGTLNKEDISFIENSLGMTVFENEEIEQKINSKIEKLEYINYYLDKIKHYKKAIYTPLLSQGYDRCLLIDSDVMIFEPINFPENSPDILISPDDIPAYRLHWSAPLKIPLVPCINSGFVYFKPSVIDIEYLNSTLKVARSLSESKWWVEQATWAIYCGNIQSKGLLDGRDARVISGIGKRSFKQIINNQFAWYSKNQPNTWEEIIEMSKGAAVIHFAGPGKKWINSVFDEQFKEKQKSYRELRWKPLKNASALEKILLSLRILAINTKENFQRKKLN